MRRYQKAGKLGSNVRVSDIVKHLDKRKGESLYVQAKFVVDTLNRYMSSADDLITTAHVPHRMMDKSGGLKHIEHSVRMVSNTDFSLRRLFLLLANVRILMNDNEWNELYSLELHFKTLNLVYLRQVVV